MLSMIHAISLGGFVKKHFADKTTQTNSESLIGNLPLDPKVSGMDIVVLQKKDLDGFKGGHLLQACTKAHPNVDLVFIYSNDKELSVLGTNQNIKTKKVSKITAQEIENVIKSIIESKNVIEKGDSVIPSKDSKLEDQARKVGAELKEKSTTQQEVAATEELQLPASVKTDLTETEEIVVQKEFSTPLSIEERLANLNAFEDFDAIKLAVKKENIVRTLINENTKYAGALTMLDVLDREISNIFIATDKTPEQKMDLIKEIALKRVTCKGELNNMLVNKFSNILIALTASMESTLKRRVDELKLSLGEVKKSQIIYKDTEVLNNLVAERLNIQLSLHEMQEKLIIIYKQVAQTGDEIVADLDKDLPSANAYINEHLKIMKPIFTPENAAEIARKLMQDIREGQVKFSLLEDTISEVIRLVFELCEHDTSIMEYQQTLITLLKANRVEDIVVVKTVLQSCLRLIVGPKNVGTRSTALALCGMMAKRQVHNSLLIDVSGDSRFGEYGVDAMSLADFLNENKQESFLCVQGLLDENEEVIEDFITELQTRLSYYPYITIVLDPSQKKQIDMLAKHSLAIQFITDITPRSLAVMKKCIADFTIENIAKKLVIIDPSVDPLKICSDLGIDTMTTKLITLPYLQRMRQLTYMHQPPYKDSSILEIFEEAFR